MEEELDHSLPFMDVNFTREADGHLARQVYQKSTHTNRYVQFDSHHPAAVKAGIIQCLTQRALTVCSSSKQCKEELDKIKEVMTYNGYHNKFIEKAISTQRKRNAAPKQAKGPTSPELINVSIPFIDGLSQAVRRIAWTAIVRCLFYTPRPL